jgi:hypothetical protein
MGPGGDESLCLSVLKVALWYVSSSKTLGLGRTLRLGQGVCDKWRD